MQMGPKEIAVEYRTAANKEKQIKILSELNQCSERRIAEILAAEGEELTKKWRDQLRKPSRRSWKYPETETEEPSFHTGAAASANNERPGARREEDPSTPATPPLRMTGEAEAVLRASLTAGTKEAQIKALAELNQCSERRIAEVLAAEGFESVAALVPEAPTGPAPMVTEAVTDRDLFEAVATLLPDGRRAETAPEAVPEKQDATASAAAPEETATVTLDPSAWNRAVERKIEPDGISAEELLRAACRMLTFALDLEAEKYHVYSCGVLDLVHALTEEG